MVQVSSQVRLVRRRTRTVWVGDVPIGGDHPIVVQSMTKVPLEDVKATVDQIIASRDAGAKVMRVAVPKVQLLDAFQQVVKASPIPVIADVHFDPRIALGVIKRGAAGLRLNPGNISDRDWLRRIAEELKRSGIALRIGVNSGSLPRDLIEKYGRTPEAMVQAALRYTSLMEDLGVTNIKVSLKSSDPEVTVEANKRFAQLTDYPLHIGVTEAGPPVEGALRSMIALQKLIPMGIGDTIRISLTSEPALEVRTANEILRLLGVGSSPTIVSCPTCGRLQVKHEEFFQLAERIANRLTGINLNVKVALMGCVVNGPGEAGDSEVALMVGGKDQVLIYYKGKPYRKTTWDKAEDELMNLLSKLTP